KISIGRTRTLLSLSSSSTQSIPAPPKPTLPPESERPRGWSPESGAGLSEDLRSRIFRSRIPSDRSRRLLRQTSYISGKSALQPIPSHTKGIRRETLDGPGYRRLRQRSQYVPA